VVVAVPVAAAFAAFKRVMVQELTGLGALFALAIVATWVTSDLVLRRRVKMLASATERLRLGDLSARTGPPYGHGRMGQLAVAFDDMAAALEARRAEAERAETAQRRLNEVLEQEARRIAHALHDEAGQLLAVVHIALDNCARELSPATRERLQEVKGHLDQVEEQLRRLSHELRPTILDNLGVVPALQFLAEGVSKRTGLAITVEGSTEGRLPVTVETAIYRVVQEGLANATKHAKASSVRIQLQREDRQIRCAILDDGIGFDLPAVLAKQGDCGLGLIGIQERLKALDGELQITSSHGQGTALLITIPLGA
jgi:signal transduction histidine kinase